MRIRVVDILSLIVGLAAGMALARFDYTHGLVLAGPPLMFCNDLLVDVCAGFALAAGVGLGVERIRARGEGRAWGVGRWVLALSAASFVLGGVGTAIAQAGHRYFESNEIKFVDHLVVVAFEVAVSSATSTFVGFLLVFLPIAPLARLPRPEAADYREWSGRIFAGLLITWRSIIFAYHLLNPDDWRIS